MSYQVELVDLGGRTVASVSASLPRLKPNQTLSPPLVSASNHRVYYLDGDTDIRSLDPSGQTAMARSIAAGTDHILAFAVSPDESRVAVALISQASDETKDTSIGYVEDLTGGGSHVVLWNNTNTSALRWPVGWHGSAVVDDICPDCGGGGYGYRAPSASSYHVVDPTNGNRLATVCESPAAPGSGYYTVNGAPTAGGVACREFETTGIGCDGTSKWTLTDVDWAGKEHDFISKSEKTCTGNGLSLDGCNVSMDGLLMACQDSTSQALTLLKPDGSTRSLGRKYNMLGWIDANHMLVDVDQNTLGVVAADSGALTSIATQHADQISMEAVLPGAL